MMQTQQQQPQMVSYQQPAPLAQQTMSDANRYILKRLSETEPGMYPYLSTRLDIFCNASFAIVGRRIADLTTGVQFPDAAEFASRFHLDPTTASILFKRLPHYLGEIEAMNKTDKVAERLEKRAALMAERKAEKSKKEEREKHVDALFLSGLMAPKPFGNLPPEPLLRMAKKSKNSESMHLWARKVSDGKPRFIYIADTSIDFKRSSIAGAVSAFSDVECPFGHCQEDCQFVDMDTETGEFCTGECQEKEGRCSLRKALFETYGKNAYATRTEALIWRLREETPNNSVIPLIADDSIFRRFCHPQTTYQNCDAWNEILSRMSCPWTFCMWLGKLVTPGDRGRQAMVLWGSGKTGNSTVMNVLLEYFGTEVSMSAPEAGSGKFTVKLSAGKLLTAAGDVSNPGYLLSDDFKLRTGGDIVYGETKFGGGESIDFHTRLLVATNFCLNINPLALWSTSRVLPIRMMPVRTPVNNAWVKDRLIGELPYFLQQCRMLAHSSQYQGDGIPITTETAKVMAPMELEVEKTLADWVVQSIVSRDGCCVTQDKIRTQCQGAMRKVQAKTGRRSTEFQMASLESYIMRIHGVQMETRYTESEVKQITGFFGLDDLEEPMNVSRIEDFIPMVPDKFGLYLHSTCTCSALPLPTQVPPQQDFASLEDLL